VDPTIFVREFFIFAGNFFARHRQFSRALRGRVHLASPRRRLVQVVEFRSRRCNRSPSLALLQQNKAAMDLLPGVASREGRRGGGDGSPSIASLQEKKAAMDLLRLRVKKGGGSRRKEATHGGKKRVARGEESYRG